MNNPTHLKINGNIYAINTDFRTWIKYERLWFDDCVTESAKTVHIFKMIFIDEPPPMNFDVLNTLMDFYICGRRTVSKNTKKDNETLYEFKIDSQKIKASFMAKFGFNPWELDYYHWWDFKACFNNLLGANFENLIKARTIDLSKFKGKELKEMAEIKEDNRIISRAEIKERKEQKKAEMELKKAYASGNVAEYLKNIK